MTLPYPFEAWIMAAEGGTSDDPDDRGRLTRFGISQRAYPALDIESLTQADAAALYARDYWAPCGANRMPPALGLAVFDGAVNHGVKTSVRLLQGALSRLGRKVRVDGIAGPETLAAAEDAYRESADETLAEYLTARGRVYFELSLDLTQRKFLRGWLKRLFRLEAACWRLA